MRADPTGRDVYDRPQFRIAAEKLISSGRNVGWSEWVDQQGRQYRRQGRWA